MTEELLYTGNKLSLEYFNKLLNENVWKAFTTVHAGIHHQMKIILLYKFKEKVDHNQSWGIIKDKWFQQLINDLFLTGIINKEFKDEIMSFNKKRNTQLGHINIYEKNEPSDQEITKVCLEGIEIIKKLDKIIKEIIFEAVRYVPPPVKSS